MIHLKEERGIWERVTTTVASQDIILRPTAMEPGRWSSRWKHMKLLISICLGFFYLQPLPLSPNTYIIFSKEKQSSKVRLISAGPGAPGPHSIKLEGLRASVGSALSSAHGWAEAHGQDICNLTHLVYGQLRSPHSCSSRGLPHFPSQPP